MRKTRVVKTAAAAVVAGFPIAIGVVLLLDAAQKRRANRPARPDHDDELAGGADDEYEHELAPATGPASPSPALIGASAGPAGLPAAAAVAVVQDDVDDDDRRSTMYDDYDADDADEADEDLEDEDEDEAVVVEDVIVEEDLDGDIDDGDIDDDDIEDELEDELEDDAAVDTAADDAELDDLDEADIEEAEAELVEDEAGLDDADADEADLDELALAGLDAGRAGRGSGWMRKGSTTTWTTRTSGTISRTSSKTMSPRRWRRVGGCTTPTSTTTCPSMAARPSTAGRSTTGRAGCGRGCRRRIRTSTATTKPGRIADRP